MIPAALVFLALATNVQSTLLLPSYWGSSMVIEADHPNMLWGLDTPGSAISVTAFGGTYNTTADSTGKFTVTLAEQPVSTTPVSITITSSSGSAITLEDVLVGWTFIMSGQVSIICIAGSVCSSLAQHTRTYTHTCTLSNTL